MENIEVLEDEVLVIEVNGVNLVVFFEDVILFFKFWVEEVVIVLVMWYLSYGLEGLVFVMVCGCWIGLKV